MSIADKITRLQTAKTNIATAITDKGGTVQSGDGFEDFSADIASIPTGSQKYGVSAIDFFGTFPLSPSEVDNNAPDMDMSSEGVESSEMGSYSFVRWLSFAKIRSFKSFYYNTTSNSNSHLFYNFAKNNKCLQYFKMDIFGTLATQALNGSNSFYGMFDGATNVKVVIWEPYVIGGSTHSYFLGGNSSSSRLIYNFRNEKTIRFHGSSMFAYFGRTNINLQRIAFNALIGISDVSAYNNCLQNFVDGGCGAFMRLDMPRLQQIGYNSSSSSYGQFKSFVLQASPFPYFYLPELTTLYNVNTTASNGTFAGSTGLRKIYLPRLTTLAGSGAQYIFNGCTNLTEIHFGKSNQATVEAFTGYASKWGATNATIFFDLINNITCNGAVYSRHQYDDHQVSLTYNNTVYFYAIEEEDDNNRDWYFCCWKDNDGNKVYTQNRTADVGEQVWSYITSPRWDYNVLGAITASDEYYGWEDSNGNIVYTKNQWTPAIGDTYYVKSADGKSMSVGGTIEGVA